LIHGQTAVGGAKIPHLYTEMMGMKLVETIISHIRANTVLGKSIRININLLQLCARIEQPLFLCHDDLKYLNNNWLLHLRDYLLQINGTLHVKNLWQPIKQRENDVILMSAFKNLDFTKLKLINNWRIFFQVATLAELCNTEGTLIKKCFRVQPLGKRIDKVNPSCIIWPCQSEPGKRGFNLWKKAISLCFNVTNNVRINQNFGKWEFIATIQKVNE
jgi:hypothetical protein